MQSMPLLLRQSLRSSLPLTRTLVSPVRAPLRPNPLPVSRPTTRSFSVCLHCRFRQQPGLYAQFDEKEKGSSDAGRAAQDVKQREPVSVPGVDAGAPGAASSSTPESDLTPEQLQAGKSAGEQSHKPDPESTTEQSVHSHGTVSGGLPSYWESRRSQVSKQFTMMMDNLQSNVFVAGQHLNDLTGYSGIEALKKEIQNQENRLRIARAQVRKAKDDYTAAINRRSTSQREVNELLQRKHAWSPTDLERFTLLYRNDHANEVAEAETQNALARAEREAEEAAAQLNKSILSRYHEEQVWSDKIRRMSTWGTWGLMGVNVLLFLIFQVAVEPWRRSRLVKGFEEKVMEALEKEKALTQTADGEDRASLPATGADSEIIGSSLEDSSVITESSRGDNASPARKASADADANTPTNTNVHQSLYSHLSNISSPFISPEYWRQAFHELFSARSVAISQRELTTITIQSAAAGAALMGLVISLIRPW